MVFKQKSDIVMNVLQIKLHNWRQENHFKAFYNNVYKRYVKG